MQRTTATAAILTLLLILLTLSGCSGKSEYYTLQPKLMPPAGTHPLSAHRVIGIGEVQVADYLEKKEVGTRRENNTIAFHQQALWAGDLGRNIQRVLKINLSRLLPTTTVLSYPWSEPLNDTHRLYLTVDQFDGDSNGSVTFMGHWSLVDQANDRLLTGEDFRYIERGGADTPGIVETQNRLLERLSRRIAARIRQYVR